MLQKYLLRLDQIAINACFFSCNHFPVYSINCYASQFTQNVMWSNGSTKHLQALTPVSNVVMQCSTDTSRQVPLPSTEPAWYTLIPSTSLKAIRDICREILRLYKRQKPDAEALEAVVSKLKKAQLEAKAKARSSLGNNTPSQPVTSRPATPSKVSPYTEQQRLKGDLEING